MREAACRRSLPPLVADGQEVGGDLAGHDRPPLDAEGSSDQKRRAEVLVPLPASRAPELSPQPRIASPNPMRVV